MLLVDARVAPGRATQARALTTAASAGCRLGFAYKPPLFRLDPWALGTWCHRVRLRKRHTSRVWPGHNTVNKGWEIHCSLPTADWVPGRLADAPVPSPLCRFAVLLVAAAFLARTPPKAISFREERDLAGSRRTRAADAPIRSIRCFPSCFESSPCPASSQSSRFRFAPLVVAAVALSRPPSRSFLFCHERELAGSCRTSVAGASVGPFLLLIAFAPPRTPCTCSLCGYARISAIPRISCTGSSRACGGRCPTPCTPCKPGAVLRPYAGKRHGNAQPCDGTGSAASRPLAAHRCYPQSTGMRPA